ncbi:MAG TPA: Wzz/FepE/Etk N-terminal domain-containing protein [bacterium]|nr:Wzz/FepE/Etk N-terminal domain-containing protein [bacterium]
MEFWRYYRVLRRRWPVVMVAMAAALVVGLLGTRTNTDEYAASATLAVPTASQFLLIANVGGGSMPTSDQLLQLAANLVRSRDVANRVIQQLQLNASPGDLTNRLVVFSDATTGTIHVTAKGPTPAAAVMLANSVADTAASFSQEVQRRQATLAREFIEKQIADAQTNLRAAEDSMLAFQQKNGTVLASSQNAQLGALQAEDQQNDFALQEANARIASYTAQMQAAGATSPAQIQDNPVTLQLRSELTQLEVALAAQLAVHTDAYPAVVALKAQIDAVKSRLNVELQKMMTTGQGQHTPIYEALAVNRVAAETDKIALEARKQAIQQALTGAAAHLPGVAQTQLDASRLNRTADILTSQVTALQDQLAQARVREQELENLGSLTVLDHANSATSSPLSGKPFKLTLAGVLGLLGGVGLAFFLEYVDTSIKTPEVAERLLGVPALAAIPRHNPPFDEAYRLLSVNLMAHDPGNDGGEVIAVTSPQPHSGTSTVVANLAQAFAAAGQRTVVVDAALRDPVQHLLFNVANEKGVAEALVGTATLPEILTPVKPNLWLVTSGTERTPDTGMQLGSTMMASVLADLRRRADIVLIDTSSAGAFADVYALAPLASGALLVLDGSRAPRGIEEQVKLQFDRLGTPVIGSVLSKVRPDLVDSYYYQEYFYRSRAVAKIAPTAAATSLGLLLIAGGLTIGLWLWFHSGGSAARALAQSTTNAPTITTTTTRR